MAPGASASAKQTSSGTQDVPVFLEVSVGITPQYPSHESNTVINFQFAEFFFFYKYGSD